MSQEQFFVAHDGVTAGPFASVDDANRHALANYLKEWRVFDGIGLLIVEIGGVVSADRIAVGTAITSDRIVARTITMADVTGQNRLP